MKKDTYLSTYTLVARQLIENADDMVDTEEEMSSDDLNITGGYSYYRILEEEKDIIATKYNIWVKTKKKYEEEEYC